MKKIIQKILFFISLVCLFSAAFLFNTTAPASSSGTTNTLWQYQCIDTMKQSRDDARAWIANASYKKDIANEVDKVKAMGANCIAIGTPYDDEFLPYLSAWVDAARTNHLHVWFRGNFSSWEGWFGYPKGMNPQDQLDKTKAFILAHPDLFQNGDIFTPAPEAENGWNNGSNVSPDNYAAYRQFLIDEENISSDAFKQIGKQVQTNWLSMSGGTAKNVLDQSTVNALGNLVTIDHYVSSPDVMDEYVDYFHNTFNAHVMIGEFGAPIPDINGDMTDDQQAAFVDSVFKELYKKRTIVQGVNYWVIADASTALLHDNGDPKPVVAVIKKYYQPAMITGRVTDPMGNTIANVTVSTADNTATVKTDSNGIYHILVPAENTILDFEKNDFKTTAREISIPSGGTYTQNVVIEPYTKDFFYNIQLMIKTTWENAILQLKSFLHR